MSGSQKDLQPDTTPPTQKQTSSSLRIWNWPSISCCNKKSNCSGNNANIWTYFAALGDSLRFPSLSIWTANLFDLFLNKKITRYGFSWDGLIIGSSFSFFIVSSFVIFNFYLNKNYQSLEKKPSDEKTHLLAHTDETQPKTEISQKKKNFYRGMGLICGIFSWMAHTQDFAAPVIFVALLAFPKLNTLGKLLVHLIVALFSGLAASADTRTDVRNFFNMVGLHSVKQKKESSPSLANQSASENISEPQYQNIKPDTLTNIAALGEAISSTIGTTYWVGLIIDSLIDAMGDITKFPQSGVGLSWLAFGLALGVGLTSTAGSTSCHYIQNKLHQAENVFDLEKIGEEASKEKLYWYQYLLLTGDFIAHLGETAGVLALLIHLILDLTYKQSLIVNIGAMAVCGIFTLAPFTTCKNNLRIDNYQKRIITLSPI